MAKLEQVFVGCPFKPNVRKNYDRLKAELEIETPLRIVLADTTSISSTDYLLEHITDLIRDSAGCVFDATDANANVSLEVGIAHALPADFLITLSVRKPRSGTKKARRASSGPPDLVKPIIADLQGRNRVEYKTYASLKDQVKRRYLVNLPYMKRWFEFEKNHKSYVPFALKLFHEIRSSGRTVGPRVEAILSGSGIPRTILTKTLTKYRLVTVRRGRDGGYFYPAK